MKAWGLIILMTTLCAACSTQLVVAPIAPSVAPYVGPVLSAPIDYDRADANRALQAQPGAAPVSST